MVTVRCLHCGEQVVQTTALGGTVWTHAETQRDECRPTYAAPDFVTGRELPTERP